jgi:hypothetical protein
MGSVTTKLRDLEQPHRILVPYNYRKINSDSFGHHDPSDGPSRGSSNDTSTPPGDDTKTGPIDAHDHDTYEAKDVDEDADGGAPDEIVGAASTDRDTRSNAVDEEGDQRAGINMDTRDQRKDYEDGNDGERDDEDGDDDKSDDDDEDSNKDDMEQSC